MSPAPSSSAPLSLAPSSLSPSPTLANRTPARLPGAMWEGLSRCLRMETTVPSYHRSGRSANA
eukprot:scaffold19696_cov128-Isochrysis_galbana.AAC.3